MPEKARLGHANLYFYHTYRHSGVFLCRCGVNDAAFSALHFDIQHIYRLGLSWGLNTLLVTGSTLDSRGFSSVPTASRCRVWDCHAIPARGKQSRRLLPNGVQVPGGFPVEVAYQ